jgi:hypothetical protein
MAEATKPEQAGPKFNPDHRWHTPVLDEAEQWMRIAYRTGPYKHEFYLFCKNLPDESSKNRVEIINLKTKAAYKLTGYENDDEHWFWCENTHLTPSFYFSKNRAAERREQQEQQARIDSVWSALTDEPSRFNAVSTHNLD